jgi:hypothetical protein
MYAVQRIIFAAEAVVGVRRSNQAAVEAVSPTVVAALDPPGEMSLRAGANAGATMPANVEECSQRVISVTRNNDAFARNLAQKVVPRLWNAAYTPDADPVFVVEAFEFFAEEAGVRVIAGRQRRRGCWSLRSRQFSPGGALGTEASFLMYPVIGLLWFYVWRRYRDNPPLEV